MANDVTSKVILGLDPSEFRRGIQQVDSKLKETSKLFGNLGQAIGAAFAVSQIQSFTAEALRLGSQLEAVGKGFSRFGNEANLEELRRATRGLVSDLDLMKVAVQAGNFGIPIQQMGQLLEFAARRAAETGQNVDYLVESIVTGIGRKSPLILDNLGISAVALKEKFGGAALEAQSIADVAKAVGEIASAELGKMGDAADTAADKMQRLSTSWENFKAKFGEAVAPAASGLLQGITNMLQVTETMGPALNRLGVKTGLAKPSDLVKPAGPKPIAAPAAAASAVAAVFSPPRLKELKLFQGELNRLTLSFTSQEMVMRSGMIPAYDEFNRMIKGALEQQEMFAVQMALMNQIGAQFGSILTSSFQSAMTNGTSFFQELGNALKNYITQMLVAVGVTAALAAVMSSILPGLSFGKAFKGISGGTGLGGIFGEGGIIELVGTLRGFDLQMSSNRTNNFLRSGN